MNSTRGVMSRVGKIRAHQIEIAGETPGPDVHDHRQLGDARSRRQAEIDHPGDQFGRQVVGDVPAEVLEHLGGGAAAGAGQPGHQHDVDIRPRRRPGCVAVTVLSSS